MAIENENLQNASAMVIILDRPPEARLREDIYRPDIEKLHLFTQMLRVSAMLKKAKVTHN